MKLLIFLSVVLVAGATEPATYDSAGELTSLIQSGAELPLHGGLFATFTGGLTVPLQPHDQKSPIVRDGGKLSWQGDVAFPNSAKAKFTTDWTESDSSVKLITTATSGSPLDLTSLDYVIDLPREKFVGGTFGDQRATFPEVKPDHVVFYQETTDHLAVSDRSGSWTIHFTFDQARPVTIVDRWDSAGRSYRIHIGLHGGFLRAQETKTFGLTIVAVAHPTAASVALSVHPAEKLYHFDGFGGDYCFNLQSPLVEYTFEQLHPAWARLEFKAIHWDRERANPGPELQRDFALMKRVQQAGIPWILSLWRLPERFYADPNQKPEGSFGRQIAADRWPEFLELLGSYLQYLKSQYGLEPNEFSFNESDLGVEIGFTGNTHREEIKRIGEHLASLGLKTKQLLGDTANPRDSHRFVLPTAADREAMRYVGALSVHSWGNGTPAQYHAWSEAKEWLQLPLIVAEAGTDPGSWRNRTYDSYAYGLKEMQQYQELLRDLHPTAILYWEYTQDYGLARMTPDGSIEPTGRFWMMKHLADLSPRQSDVIVTSSDQTDTLISAFEKGSALTVHILNVGPERDASISGLPAAAWKIVTTTETAGFQSNEIAETPTKLRLPARSFVTLVRK
jgi:hypothetical protein